MKIRFTLLLLLTGLFLLPSCLPDFNFNGDDLDDKWKPGYAIPLLDVDLTMQKALNRFSTGGFVTTNPEDLVIVVYRGNRISISGGQLFNLPDVQIPLIDSTMTIPVPFPSPTELDNIKLKQGQLIFSVSSNETQSINIDFSLPDFTIGGLPYSKQYVVPASNGSTPSVISDTVDMNEMNLSFTGGDFRMEYTAVRADGQHLQLPNASLELLNMDYSYIDGYLGSTSLSFATGLNTIDIFKDWNQGNIIFEEPKIKFNFRNSYGMPIRLAVDSFSVNTHFNGVTVLQNTDLANGVDLAFPSLAEVGQFKSTSLTLDVNNSNINDIVSNVPFEFYYDLAGNVNPDNNTSVDNFITDSSRLEIDIDFELPMYGSAGFFSLKDTLEFDFNEYRDFDRMKLRTVTENGFPFEVQFQVYFLDANNTAIDSLFNSSTTIMGAASVNANGRVTAPNNVELEADINEARYSNLKDNSTRLVLVANIATTDGGSTPVKIFTDYHLIFQMGAIIGI